ncbi:MAG: TraR/DksA family transcriptional regulator [Hyphomicrobiales bacterium]
MSDFDSAKQALKTRREELAARVSSINATLQAPLSADFEEQAGDLEGQEQLERLEASALKELGAIDAALGRIAAGTYGICVKCGEPIARKRLEAVPTATTCVACKD